MKTVSHIRRKAKITPASCLSWILLTVLITALYFIVSSTIACAGQVTLGWDKSTEPEVAGYKVYYGTATRNYTQNVKITSPDITTCTIINLTEGQKYYFAATAYNAELIESDYSAEVFTTITPVTTSVPTTTTTVQPTTSSSTTSLLPTTTTTVQPTTSSSTTALVPTSTTTVQPTTSSTTIPTTSTTISTTPLGVYRTATKLNTVVTNVLSFDIECPATNGFLLVGVFNTASVEPSSVTYTKGGVATNMEHASGTANYHVSMWHMVAPDPGIHTITITLPTAANNIIALAVSLTGVDQNNPIRGITNASSEWGTSPNQIISASENGDLVLGLLSTQVSPTDNQTTQVSNSKWGEYLYCSSKSGAPNCELSWTLSSNSNSYYKLISIIPASLVPATSTTTSSALPASTTTTVQPTTSTSIYSGGGGGGGGGGGSVVVTNITPIADAGADQSAFDGDLITLDGSGSYDNDGDTLTYQWAQVSGPTVTLSDSAAAQPEFHAPAVGTFTFSLVVSDGQASSVLDTVTITVKEVDNRPVAMAGNDLTVQIGDKVVLDGTASYDSDGDTLSYKWIQVSGPAVNLSNPDSATPYFIAAIEGNYQFNLTVFDGILWSSTDSVVITIKQPAINLISPGIDVKVSGSVKLTWNGTGFVNFKVLTSKDGKSFTSLGETTNQEYTISSLTTLMLSGRKGSPIYWKIQGQRSVQNDYWVTSETRKFYAARTLRIYQNAIRELLAMIFNKQYESPSHSQTVINEKELLPQYMVRSLIESP